MTKLTVEKGKTESSACGSRSGFGEEHKYKQPTRQAFYLSTLAVTCSL